MGGQPTRMNYVDMMEDAGLGDVLIPKKEFVKEHERLVSLLNQSDIPALRKEAKAQQAELAKKGGSVNSNFIARLMAEAKYKNAVPADKAPTPYRPLRGPRADKNPTKGRTGRPAMDPESDDTTMSQAIKFNYKKIANKEQLATGENQASYGASPFIRQHFGNVSAKTKETSAQSAARKKFRSVLQKQEGRLEAMKSGDSTDKRVASRKDFQRRLKALPLSERAEGEKPLLPESQKRKARREKQKQREEPVEEAEEVVVDDEKEEPAEDVSVDYRIAPEVRDIISRPEVEKRRANEEKLAKLMLMRKQARELIPRSQYDNHPLTKKLDKQFDKLMTALDEDNVELRKTVNERIKRKMGYDASQNDPKRKELYQLAFAPFAELREKMKEVVSIKPITRENINTYNPKV